jgi:hypothetical protein
MRTLPHTQHTSAFMLTYSTIALTIYTWLSAGSSSVSPDSRPALLKAVGPSRGRTKDCDSCDPDVTGDANPRIFGAIDAVSRFRFRSIP